MKKIKLISFVGIVALSTLAISCSKDRIEKSVNEYESINSYLNTKKQAEQVFVVDSNGNGPIVGNQGTKIWISKSCLQKANGDTVSWPFTVKLVELYTPKDLIYYQMPSVSSIGILENAGEIRLRAFKDDEELQLKPYPCKCVVKMPNTAPKSYMRVFYGFDNNLKTDWSSNLSQFGISLSMNPYFAPADTGYMGDVGKLGWIGCDTMASTNSGYKITFQSETDELQNIGIFVYMPSINSVMQVYNMTSGRIPNGMAVKILCMGIDSDGKLYSFYKSTTIGSDATLEVTMKEISESNLTSLLNGL